MPQLSVLIADADIYLRDKIRQIIAMQGDMLIVDEAQNAEEVEHKVREKHPQILLLDMSLPSSSGLSTTDTIARATEFCRVVVMSLHHDEVYLREAYRAGAMGFQLKTAPADRLLRTIRLVARCDRRSFSPWPPPDQSIDRRKTFIPSFAKEG